MGHDAHFLQRLDRVTREHTDLALALYRDHELVRQLLESGDLPPHAERVAFALDDGGLGPHVVVARTGAFVTCLGRGMTTVGTPVLSRAKVDATMARRADLRERMAVARAYARKGEDDGDFLARFVTRKNTLTREEIRGISAFAPLLGEELYIGLVKNLREASNVAAGFRREARTRRVSPALIGAHAGLVWSGVHGVQLFGFAGPESLAWLLRKYEGRFAFSMPTTLMVNRSIVLRGLWAAAQLGEPLLESYMRRLTEQTSALRQLDAAAGLAAIALKHRALEPDVTKFLRRFALSSQGDLTQEGRRGFAALALTAVAARDEWPAHSLEIGRKRFVETATDRLPSSHPLAPSGDDCDPDLARTCVLNEDVGLTDGDEALASLFTLLPLTASSPLEAFFYPSSVSRHLVEPWGQEEVSRHMEQILSVVAAPAQAKSEGKVGRNEPCPCGSGKKAKKCCSQ